MEGQGAEESVQGGEGQDWRIQAAGRAGRLQQLGPPGRRQRLHCTTDPHLWRAPYFPILRGAPAIDPSPAPPLRLRSGTLGLFRRALGRRGGGSSAPFAPLAFAPAPSAAGGHFPRARARRPPERAWPPIKEVGRARHRHYPLRSELRGAEAAKARRSLSTHPSPTYHCPHPEEPVRGREGERGRKRGPRAADPWAGSRIAPGEGRGQPRTGEPGGPRRSLRRAGSRASRSRPAYGAWAVEEPPGRVWAPVAGMSLTGRRGWRGRWVPPPQPRGGRALSHPIAAGGAGAPLSESSPPSSRLSAPPTAPSPFPRWGATFAPPFPKSLRAMPA